MTLTEFLSERIAEDEREVRSFGTPPPMEEGPIPYPRLLVECEAKRRLLDLADTATDYDEDLWSEFGIGRRDMEKHPYLGDLILRALALPYAAHPDYLNEWKP